MPSITCCNTPIFKSTIIFSFLTINLSSFNRHLILRAGLTYAGSASRNALIEGTFKTASKKMISRWDQILSISL